MGGHITVSADPKDKAAQSPRKGDSILSRFMKPEHKRMSRMLGYCLTLGEPRAWHGFSTVAYVRLTPAERACLSFASLQSLPEDQAIETAAAVFEGAGYPLRPFLGGMEDARWWASLASVNELKAYALAAFEALPPKERAAFFRFINEIEVPA